MKLHEIKRLAEASKSTTEVFKDCDLWQSVGSESDLDQADIEVEYDYESASHTVHPYGQGSAREEHGSNVGVLAVRLMQDTDRLNDDGEPVGTMKKGTDLMKETWWQGKWSGWLADQIREKMDDPGDHEYR